MKVGIPREVKNHEYRVAITPAGVHELVRHGHEVFVETDAGVGSSISNDEYVAAGAKILPTADDVWGTGDLILKVKEPIEQEYGRMRAGQTLSRFVGMATGWGFLPEGYALGLPRTWSAERTLEEVGPRLPDEPEGARPPGAEQRREDQAAKAAGADDRERLFH